MHFGLKAWVSFAAVAYEQSRSQVLPTQAQEDQLIQGSQGGGILFVYWGLTSMAEMITPPRVWVHPLILDTPAGQPKALAPCVAHWIYV